MVALSKVSILVITYFAEEFWHHEVKSKKNPTFFLSPLSFVDMGQMAFSNVLSELLVMPSLKALLG